MNKSEKGVDYILSKTYKTPINGISDIPKLQEQFIPLDHLSTSVTKSDCLEKRKESRNKRKHKWKFMGTRSLRKNQQEIDKKSITFQSIEPISQMWQEYASRINETEISVAKMDLHGANIKITASPDPSIVGVSGRILKEGHGSMILVTEKDEIKHINKNHPVITLQTPKSFYEVNLSAMMGRPYHRTSKKWKARYPIPLPF